VSRYSKLCDAVEAAANDLDEMIPDWFNRIDLDNFDMSNGTQESDDEKIVPACIMCQLADPDRWGDKYYSEGMRSMFGCDWRDYRNIDAFQVDTVPLLTVEAVAERYAELDELWTDQVKARRSGNA
jgi:hypothetical protein